MSNCDFGALDYLITGGFSLEYYDSKTLTSF